MPSESAIAAIAIPENFARESDFRILAEAIPQLVWRTDEQGRCDFLNQQWFDYTGFSCIEEVVANWLTVILHPADAPPVIAAWEGALATGNPFQVEYRLRRFDGVYRWFKGTGVRRPDSRFGGTDTAQSWFGISTDIEDQKRFAEEKALLLQAAEAANSELKRANSDLQQFAYAAAHDLREPLRMVNAYTQLIAKHLGPSMNDNLRQYFHHVQNGAERLGMLLEDLLAYVETGRSDNRAESIALNHSLSRVLSNLEESIRQSGCEVEAAPLPTVRLPRGAGVQLLQNLIGNAIKYAKPGVAPKVTITLADDADFWSFRVADNGIGISPEYQDQVFGVFRRLHGPEIPGTGIGLSICQRIVDQAGGRIWIESDGQSGTTFCFTLPKIALA